MKVTFTALFVWIHSTEHMIADKSNNNTYNANLKLSFAIMTLLITIHEPFGTYLLFRAYKINKRIITNRFGHSVNAPTVELES